MLRITLPTASHSGLFILEGRLTGLWAKELLRVARAANQGYGNTFDLQEVLYVDAHGEEALRWLGGRGAKFITDSAYGKHLCDRLQLCRVSCLKTDLGHGKRREASFKPTERRAAHDASYGALAAADVNQHPSSYGK